MTKRYQVTEAFIWEGSTRAVGGFIDLTPEQAQVLRAKVRECETESIQMTDDVVPESPILEDEPTEKPKRTPRRRRTEN
jgi:hypothetical protein